eukprot:RCo023257
MAASPRPPPPTATTMSPLSQAFSEDPEALDDELLEIVAPPPSGSCRATPTTTPGSSPSTAHAVSRTPTASIASSRESGVRLAPAGDSVGMGTSGPAGETVAEVQLVAAAASSASPKSNQAQPSPSALSGSGRGVPPAAAASAARTGPAPSNEQTAAGSSSLTLDRQLVIDRSRNFAFAVSIDPSSVRVAPAKHGGGGEVDSAQLVFIIDTKTRMRQFRLHTMTAVRQLGDFVWLRQALARQNPGVLVPRLPAAQPSDLLIQAGLESVLVVLQRRLLLFLVAAGAHPVLYKSELLHLFLSQTPQELLAFRRAHSELEPPSSFSGLLSGAVSGLKALWARHRPLSTAMPPPPPTHAPCPQPAATVSASGPATNPTRNCEGATANP